MKRFDKALITRPARAMSALGITAALLSPLAWSEADSSAYRMAVIVDEAQGKTVLSGDYEQAIDRMAARAIHQRRYFPTHNNLCVAYTMSNELAAATAACDNAVISSKRRIQKRDRAIALSNRGVLKVLLGDKDGATEDMATAVNLRQGLSEPAFNLSRLADTTVENAAVR